MGVGEFLPQLGVERMLYGAYSSSSCSGNLICKGSKDLYSGHIVL